MVDPWDLREIQTDLFRNHCELRRPLRGQIVHFFVLYLVVLEVVLVVVLVDLEVVLVVLQNRIIRDPRGPPKK